MIKNLRKYLLTALAVAVALPLILALNLLLPNKTLTAEAAYVTPTIYWGIVDDDPSNVPAGATIASPQKLILSAGDVSGATDGGSFAGDASYEDDAAPWYDYAEFITSVKVQGTVAPASTSSWFFGLTQATEIDLSDLDTSNVTYMSGMFYYCSSLTTLILSGSFDTSNVTDMYSMFNGCSSLTTLDLSNFDTSNVTEMREMFCGCSSLVELNLSNFDTSNIYSMYNMFNGCSSLIELDLSSFDTSGIGTSEEIDPSMGNMFNGCSSLTTLILPGSFDTSNVGEMYGMFSGCSSLTTLDLSNFDMSNVWDADEMLEGCTSLNEIKTPYALDDDTSIVLPGQFWDGENYISRITSADVKKTICLQFYWGVIDSELIISSSPADVADITEGDKHGTFAGDDIFSSNTMPWYNYRNSITSVKVQGTVAPESTECWFYGLSNATSFDFSGLNTSKVENMNWMFNGCSSLTELNLSNFNTSNVESMLCMFMSCASLTSLNMSGFTIKNGTSTNQMLGMCPKLQEIITPNEIGDNVSISLPGPGYYKEGNSITRITSADTNSTIYLHTECGGGDATCTQKAVCSICGNEYGEVLGHNYKEATCTEPKTCVRCGETEGEALGHDFVNGTYTSDNSQHWKVCKDCNAEDTENKEDCDGGEATCKAKAVCSVCGNEYGGLDENNHSPAAEAVKENEVAATCSKAGSYDEVVYCSECGEEVSREEKTVEKPAHTPAAEEVKENEVAATCSKAGSYDEVVYCSVCGEEISREEKTVDIDNAAHDWGEWTVTKEATCTEKGEQTRICSHDKTHKETKEINAKGHTEVKDDAVAATCTEAGKTEGKHCSVCNTVLVAQTTVAAKGHTEVKDDAVAATCTEAGKTEGKHCSVCNTVLVAQTTVAALGHNYGEWTTVTAPTCTAVGEQQRVCTHDSSHKETKSVSALGHDWGEWTVSKDATVKENGEEQRVCSHDSTHIETRETDKPEKKGLPAGAIAGIVIAALAILLIAAYILGYFLLYRKGILLKGKFFDVIYVPMDAMFNKE